MRWKSSPYGKDALPIALDIYERIASLHAVDQADCSEIWRWSRGVNSPIQLTDWWATEK
jgi:hypothetical protein